MVSKFRITIGTELEPFIIVHHHDGTRFIFRLCMAGHYYFDTTNEAFSEDQTTDYKCLNTVGINKSCFHRREIKVADEARILQQLVGWLYTKTLKEAIQKNQLRNCLITTNDIRRVEAIYVPQILIIQGKTIIRSIDHHKTIHWIPLPPLMVKHHQNVELAMDLFFVNGSTFLHTKLRKIDFRSFQACNNRGKSETISGLKQVKTKYKYICFTITDYHVDNEFEHL